MLKDIGAEPYFLRLGVSDGGCSGLSYSILFDDSRQEDDRVIEWKGFEVVIGNASEEYFEGVHIDYMETGMTGGFTIDNPNAKFTCGCGASFRTAAYRGKAKKCD
ncbi:iron-sulfur cluster assembly accessory protein [Paenibacillus profundus]|uniref:Iron-sulfur cluster assembly accessory protein n=2 Tax=Paenibacillus TaxID=44249 RepID=A0ABS8YNE8_9BACL|nr:iron-sulfur cluster assembly accessory protein [Paenibacillus profundus]MCE5172709.1 iron-sulfur cluster assembly accessory protein [Paenibacillus profundus]